jgi:hypothetical protein
MVFLTSCEWKLPESPFPFTDSNSVFLENRNCEGVSSCVKESCGVYLVNKTDNKYEVNISYNQQQHGNCELKSKNKKIIINSNSEKYLGQSVTFAKSDFIHNCFCESSNYQIDKKVKQ